MPQVSDVMERPDLYRLRDGLTLGEIEERVGVAYAGAGLRHRVICFYLEKVNSSRLYQLAGCRTLAQWTALRFGMSRRETRELLEAGRALMELPVIDEAFARGRLCWSKVRLLVSVATPRTEAEWLERAVETPIDELALQVKLARSGEAPRDRDDRKGLPEVRVYTPGTALPPDVYAKRERANARLNELAGRSLEEWECLEAMYDMVIAMPPDGPDRPSTINSPYTVIVNRCSCSATDHEEHASVQTQDGEIPISPLTGELIACDGNLLDPASPDGRHKDRIPGAMRRRVLARDNYRCRRCASRLHLHEHHIVPEEDGGPTEDDNLATLCRPCHTLVHAGLIKIEGTPSSGLRFIDQQGRDLEGVEPTPADGLAALAAVEGTSTRLLEMPQPQQSGAMRHLRPRTGLRPSRPGLKLDELVGQGDVVEALKDAAAVATERDEPMGHTLLTGPPGLGKTTIACAVAGALGVEIHAVSAPFLESPADLLPVIGQLGRRDILFIDEIHALPRRVAETLYEAMDRTHFTLIGATTEPGSLPEPFLSRFEIVEHLDFYKPCDLATLVAESATRQGLAIDAAAALRLAEVARGTPRRALQLLRRCRTVAIAEGRCGIDRAIVERTLDKLGIDELGLDRIDRRYLEILRSRGSGRPISLARLAAMLGMDAEALQRLHEPYLFRLGLIATTPAGRIAVA